MPFATAALVGGGLSLVGGLMAGDRAKEGAYRQAQAQENAARMAAEASKFRPVGVTTRFGTSQFQKDDQGNVIGAGYNLTPDMLARQNQLMGISDLALQQYQQGFGQAQQLGQAGQGLMGLGQGYLATSPQEQAAKYMAEQQGLLAPSRQAALAGLQNQQFQQGRTGLAVGGDAGRMATNPEMAAYYNAIAQQDRELAARATQGGMEYAKFGAGLLGTGGGMLGSMYDLQSQAYSPFQTAMGGAQNIEGMGQNAMDLGINIGARGTAASQVGAGMMQSGMNAAAASRARGDANDPFANLLMGAGQGISQYGPQISNWWDRQTSPGYVNTGSVTGSDMDIYSSNW